MAWLPDKKTERPGSIETGDPSLPRSDREKSLHEIKKRLHRTLVERLDVSQLELMEENLVAAEIRRAVAQLLADDPFPLNTEERGRLAQEIEFEILGLGPLEPLVRDNTISDILVNRYDEIYIERYGLPGPDGCALPGQRPPDADHP
jgi:hypothetical protein